jgi:hypothetical protein
VKPTVDQLKQQAAEAAARGLDLLDDEEVRTALEHFHHSMLGLIGTMQVKGLSYPEVASVVGGTCAQILRA